MQQLTAGPRAHLTEQQVRQVLTARSVEVAAGCDRLNPATLAVAESLDAHTVGGFIERNMNREPHATLSLDLTRKLRWGIDLVRPWQSLTDRATGLTARWHLGAYVLTTPTSEIGEDEPVYQVQGFDRLRLLEREVAAAYSVAAGVTYRQALLDVFAAAGLTGVLIEGSAADSTLPQAKSYPLIGTSTDPDQTTSPVTWLRIVNDLLTAINYRGVWADESGLFRCQAYLPPAERAPEWVFDADDRLTILSEERSVTEDVWALPTRWVFRWTNAPAGTAGADLTYQRDLPAGHELSAQARGLVWPRVIDYEAASRAAFVALGDRRVALDTASRLSVAASTGPFPGAGHFDVFTYTDAAAGGTSKVQAASWRLPLDGGDVTWTWERVA